MSFNQNLYGYKHTLHDGNIPLFYNFPPPPLPPPILTDKEFIKSFENKIMNIKKHKKQTKTISITLVRNILIDVCLKLNAIKHQEKALADKIDTLNETEWNSMLHEIKQQKESIVGSLSYFNNPCNMELLKKLLAKRSAKRLRLKRVHLEKRREKEERIKELQEKSRKIDENLKKVQDDIMKAKQEEEAKLEADSVLKDVLRKKHDAKKCIVKLDALIKLHKARQNTAKGRGDAVDEKKNVEYFNQNIEKLKNLWLLKQAKYEKEETELRSKLLNKQITHDDNKVEIEKNLVEWKKFLFGGDLQPQVDFSGEAQRFLAIRSQWDQFINSEGTPIPMGWVVPKFPANP